MKPLVKIFQAPDKAEAEQLLGDLLELSSVVAEAAFVSLCGEMDTRRTYHKGNNITVLRKQVEQDLYGIEPERESIIYTNERQPVNYPIFENRDSSVAENGDFSVTENMNSSKYYPLATEEKYDPVFRKVEHHGWPSSDGAEFMQRVTFIPATKEKFLDPTHDSTNVTLASSIKHE